VHPAERGEIEAMRDLYSAAPAGLAARYGISVDEVAGATCLAVTALADVTFFNRAIGLGIEQDATDEDIVAVAGHFARLGTRAFVAVDPAAAPADLPMRLERLGFTAGYAWEKFMREPDPSLDAPTDLRVECIDTAWAQEFGRVAAEGFAVPAFLGDWLTGIVGRAGWHCYLAFDGETPAACGVLYEAGDVGWLGIGAALPQFRGRGAQSALLAARIGAGAELGLATLVTETGVVEEGRPSFSHRNILRSGFRPVYVRPNYVTPDP
jgi:hypothetical protein